MKKNILAKFLTQNLPHNIYRVFSWSVDIDIVTLFSCESAVTTGKRLNWAPKRALF